MPAPARGLPQSQPRPSPPTKFVQSSHYPLPTRRRGPRVAAPPWLLDSTEIGGSHRSILLTCQAGRFSWSRVHALHGSAAPVVALEPIDAERAVEISRFGQRTAKGAAGYSSSSARRRA